MSLRTRCAREARAFAARLSVAFEEARVRGILTHEQMRTILRSEAGRRLRKLQTLASTQQMIPTSPRRWRGGMT